MCDKPLEFGVSYPRIKLCLFATCLKLLRSLNQKSGIHWWVTQPHTLCTQWIAGKTWYETMVFPLKFTSFLWLSPTISLELSWKPATSTAHLQKRVVLYSARGSSGDQTCLTSLVEEDIAVLTYHWTRLINMMPSFEGIFWIYSKTLRFKKHVCEYECRYDMIRYQWYQSGHRLQRKNHLRILARSIAIPRIISCTTQSGLGSPAVTPRAMATPLKSENSREKLLGTSGRDGC